jgi:hypothetical protein
MENNSLSSRKIDRISEWSNYRLTGARDLMQNKRKLVPVVLLAIAVLSGVLIVAKAMGFFITSARAQRIVKQATAWSKPDPNVVESQLAKSKLIAEDLKENNLFWPSPKGHPVKAVLGIFGDEAYIDGKWYKVGAKIRDAKIVAIDADSVTTEWEGKKIVFRPIDAEGSPASDGPKSGPERPMPKPGATGEERAEIAAVRPDAPPRRGPEGGSTGVRGGPNLSEEDRAKMIEEMEKARK